MTEGISLSESFVRGEATSRFWGLIGKGFGIASTFLILASLTPYQYGVWFLFLSFYEIFSQVLALGAGVVKNDVMRFIGASDYRRAKRLFCEYHTVRIILSVILWAFFFFGAPLLSFRYTPDFIIVIRVASFLFLLEFASSFAQAILTTQFRFGAAARVIAYAKTSQLIVLICYFYFSYIGVKEVIFSLAISIISSVILILPTVLHEWRPWRERKALGGEWLVFKTMRGHGKWDISRSFVSHITSRVQPFVIKILLNTEAAGIYGVAKSLVELLLSFLSVDTLSSLVPRQIQTPGKMRTIFVFGSKYLFIASIAFIIVGALGAAVLFNLLFGNYLPALPFFYLLALILPAQAIGQMIDVFLITWQRQKFTFIRSLVRSTLWLALLVLLLPIAGLWGAVSAEVFVVLISVIWSYAYLVKLEPAFRPKSQELFSFGANDKEIRDVVFRNFINIIKLIRR